MCLCDPLLWCSRNVSWFYFQKKIEKIPLPGENEKWSVGSSLLVCLIVELTDCAHRGEAHWYALSINRYKLPRRNDSTDVWLVETYNHGENFPDFDLYCLWKMGFRSACTLLNDMQIHTNVQYGSILLSEGVEPLPLLLQHARENVCELVPPPKIRMDKVGEGGVPGETQTRNTQTWTDKDKSTHLYTLVVDSEVETANKVKIQFLTIGKLESCPRACSVETTVDVFDVDSGVIAEKNRIC